MSTVTSVAGNKRIVWLLTGSLALLMTGYGMVFPVFARRLAELGSGVDALGYMAVAFALGQLIAGPPMGALADRIGRRPLILLALASVAIGNIAFLLADNVGMFIVARGLVGVLSAGLLPAAMAVVGDIMPSDQRARWTGTLMGGYGVGFIFGPTLGGVLYDSLGFAMPFLVSAGLGVVGLVLALAWLPETRPVRTALQGLRTATPGLRGIAALPRPYGILITLLVLDFLSVFLFAFVEPQLAFYLYDTLHFSTTSFGLIVGAYGLAMVIGQAALGHAADRYGTGRADRSRPPADGDARRGGRWRARRTIARRRVPRHHARGAPLEGHGLEGLGRGPRRRRRAVAGRARQWLDWAAGHLRRFSSAGRHRGRGRVRGAARQSRSQRRARHRCRGCATGRAELTRCTRRREKTTRSPARRR